MLWWFHSANYHPVKRLANESAQPIRELTISLWVEIYRCVFFLEYNNNFLEYNDNMTTDDDLIPISCDSEIHTYAII